MTFPQTLRSLVALTLFALPAFAGNNLWTIKGPDGGSVSKLVFDPVDSSIAYAASDNGIFRSSDGGQHWTGAAELLGTSVFDIAVASSDPQKVFASTVFGLYKSADRGLTWKTIHPFASYRVAVSRQNANIVYSVSTGGPFRSSDGGVTFDNVGSGLPSLPSSANALVIDPQNDSTVYASFLTSAGVYKSVDGGAHWTAANGGLTLPQYFSLVIDPSNGSTLFVGAAGGIFKTVDGGTSWTPQQTPASSVYCYALSISASSPSTLVAGTNRGLLKTTTGGSIWTGPVGTGDQNVTAAAIDPTNAANILIVATYSASRSSNGGSSFSLTNGLTAFYTQAIATDPQNASRVYASGPAGIFKSADRGVTWSAAGPASAAIAVDPFNSLTLYAIFAGTFRRSLDGGGTWQDFTTGLPSASAIVVTTDPQSPGTLYTIVGNAPYKKAGTDPWVIRSAGLPATGFPSFIAVDPHNASTLYTGGGFGLFKSIDGGASWTSAAVGLTSANVSGVAVDPFDSKHLLSLTSPVFESTDGASTWHTLDGAKSGTLVFDPTTRNRIYDSSFSAVDLSVDGGKTWSSLSNGLGFAHGSIFAVSPDSGTLYSGGSTGGVWTFTFSRRPAVKHASLQ